MSSPSSSPSEAAANAVAELSLAKQISLLSGRDTWATLAVGAVPSIKVTDGPVGARGDSTTGAKAVCLPASIAQAATFDTALVAELGRLLGREALRKGAQVLLAPTINLARHPLGGRNFESFGEEPNLTAAMGVAYITGVQDEGVAACAKHFVANDVEWRRLSVSSEVDEVTLREAYLAPFESVVAAGVLTVMSAYPKLNGVHCSENPWLLRSVLRDEWGFDGVVISDWGATHQAGASIAAGLDLEMPGPALALGEHLAAAVQAGEVTAESVAAAAVNIAELAVRTGGLDREPEPERSVDEPEDRALARRAAAEAMVLLSNRGGVLPFGTDLRSVAVVGPNADPGVAQGGGSAAVPSHYEVSPLAGLRSAIPGAEVVNEPGCLAHRYLPLVDADRWAGPVRREVFATAEPEGQPVLSDDKHSISAFVDGVYTQVPDPSTYSWRWTATLPIEASGGHRFSVFAIGRSRVLVNGQLVVDNWTNPQPGHGYFEKASEEVVGSIELEAGSAAEVVVEWSRGHDDQFAALRFGYLAPVDEDALMDRAVAAAAAAEAAVVVVGLNAEWETESHDRFFAELPGRQNELVERVLDAQPNTVVVVNAGSPVAMDWFDRAPATLMAWYPGQEGGNALADVVFGACDAGGRLPITIPRQVSDAPSASSVPSSEVPHRVDIDGPDSKLHYAEQLFIGHRGYYREGITPLAAFGHGVSYARFEFAPAAITGSHGRLDEPALGAGLHANVVAKNTSDRPGKCVVQAYFRPDDEARPRVLAGFAAALLKPGEERTVSVPLSDRCLQGWDVETGGWQPLVGEHRLEIATSSVDVIESLPLTVTAKS